MDNSRSIFSNLRYLISEIWRKDKLIFFYFFIFTVFTAIQPLIAIIFPKVILNELIDLKRANILIVILSLYFLIGSATNFLVEYIKGLYFPRVNHMRLSFLGQVYKVCMVTDYTNTESSEFLDRLEVVSKSLRRSDMGIEGLIHEIFSFGGIAITLLIYVFMISKLNIFILIITIITVVLLYYLTLKQKNYEHEEKKNISNYERKARYINAIMFDFTYGKDIRLFNISNIIFNKFKYIKEKKLDTEKQIGKHKLKTNALLLFIQIVREIVVYAYLIYIYNRGTITIAELIMYISLISAFANILVVIIQKIASIYSCNLDIEEFRRFISIYDEEHKDDFVDIPEVIESIEFKNVSFKYPGKEDYILKNINTKFTKNENISIVGHNGAGKTTFIKLLCRLYDVTQGEILLNGININRFSKKDYYNLFSVVFQEVIPLAFSVAENIALTDKEHIDYAKLKKILDYLGMLEVVEKQKYGIDTAMQKFIDNAGTQFSGGQNQKILMARSIYKDSRIVILDEPTSALDPLAEREIYTQFNEIVTGKLAFYISHRMASTQFCNRILVFENGTILESGTHIELMENKGKYYDMFSVQAHYYNTSEVVS